MDRRVINPWTWQDGFGYVQAIETSGAGAVLHCAGQAAMDASGQPMHEGDMSAQVKLAFDNLEQVLHTAGYQLSDVVRLTYYVTDVDAFLPAYSDEVRRRLAPKNCRPTCTLLGVSRLALPQLMVEIEATAVK